MNTWKSEHTNTKKAVKVNRCTSIGITSNITHTLIIKDNQRWSWIYLNPKRSEIRVLKLECSRHFNNEQVSWGSFARNESILNNCLNRIISWSMLELRTQNNQKNKTSTYSLLHQKNPISSSNTSKLMRCQELNSTYSLMHQKNPISPSPPQSLMAKINNSQLKWGEREREVLCPNRLKFILCSWPQDRKKPHNPF